MNKLEIIHLRSSGEPLETLANGIRESIEREAETDGFVIELYRRERLSTDLAVHIHHGGVFSSKGPSGLALLLASELRAFGLVEHTPWEEIE